MACPIHISFRNLSPSEAVENACWREAAAMADVPDIENCRLRIEGTPSFPRPPRSRRSSRPGTEPSDRGQPLDSGPLRVTLDCRIRGSVIRIDEQVAAAPPGGPGWIDAIAAAVRAAVTRGRAAALWNGTHTAPSSG